VKRNNGIGCSGDVAYALVVLGATGRTTLLRCDARAGTWSVDAR